jgi:RHS repeat-associated protein
LNYALGLPSVAVVNSGGADKRYYIHLPDGTLLYSVEATGNVRNYFHFDEAGNTIFLTADSGSVSASYGITPYGESVTQTGSGSNPFTWQGKFGVMQEGATSLYYLRARYYDAAPGRFLTRDPLDSLAPNAIDPYQYALGNPVSFVDPSGLSTARTATTNFDSQYLFGQDPFSFRADFSFNLGLRYADRRVPVSFAQDNKRIDGQDNNSISIGGPTTIVPPKFVPDGNNFAPVLGSTYSPRFNQGMLRKLFGPEKTFLDGDKTIEVRSPDFTSATPSGGPILATFGLSPGFTLPPVSQPAPGGDFKLTPQPFKLHGFDRFAGVPAVSSTGQIFTPSAPSGIVYCGTKQAIERKWLAKGNVSYLDFYASNAPRPILSPLESCP